MRKRGEDKRNGGKVVREQDVEKNYGGKMKEKSGGKDDE